MALAYGHRFSNRHAPRARHGEGRVSGGRRDVVAWSYRYKRVKQLQACGGLGSLCAHTALSVVAVVINLSTDEG